MVVGSRGLAAAAAVSSGGGGGGVFVAPAMLHGLPVPADPPRRCLSCPTHPRADHPRWRVCVRVCMCGRASLRACAQALAVVGLCLVASGLAGRRPAAASALLQVNQAHMLRQRGARAAAQSLFGGWSTVTPEQFDGRCRCTGYKTYNPDQRVVCACTGLPGGDNKDLWRKGPWKILTGCASSPPHRRTLPGCHHGGRMLHALARAGVSRSRRPRALLVVS